MRSRRKFKGKHRKARASPASRYERLIERVFFAGYSRGASQVGFHRTDLEDIAKSLDIALPKNLGDLIYSFRYRTALPSAIRRTAPSGTEWIIEPAGRAKYRFVLAEVAKITPNASLVETKVPDATPGVIAKYALTDEQALLAKIRYNRLVDIFTGVTCYSLQSHLRTTVPEIGQVETDEVYKDTLSTVQIRQDIAMCAAKWPRLICRPIAAQHMEENFIAMFELERPNEGELKIVAEKHYRLVSPDALSPEDLEAYRRRSD